MPETASAAIDFDKISYFNAKPSAHTLRGVRPPVGHLLMVAVLGILRRWQNLRDLAEVYLAEPQLYHRATGLASVAAAIRFRVPIILSSSGRGGTPPVILDWLIAKIPSGIADLGQLV